MKNPFLSTACIAPIAASLMLLSSCNKSSANNKENELAIYLPAKYQDLKKAELLPTKKGQGCAEKAAIFISFTMAATLEKKWLGLSPKPKSEERWKLLSRDNVTLDHPRAPEWWPKNKNGMDVLQMKRFGYVSTMWTISEADKTKIYFLQDLCRSK